MCLDHDPVDRQALSDGRAAIRRLRYLYWNPAIEKASGFSEEITRSWRALAGKSSPSTIRSGFSAGARE
jgi:PAS domain-containing protein